VPPRPWRLPPPRQVPHRPQPSCTPAQVHRHLLPPISPIHIVSHAPPTSSHLLPPPPILPADPMLMLVPRTSRRAQPHQRGYAHRPRGRGELRECTRPVSSTHRRTAATARRPIGGRRRSGRSHVGLGGPNSTATLDEQQRTSRAARSMPPCCSRRKRRGRGRPQHTPTLQGEWRWQGGRCEGGRPRAEPRIVANPRRDQRSCTVYGAVRRAARVGTAAVSTSSSASDGAPAATVRAFQQGAAASWYDAQVSAISAAALRAAQVGACGAAQKPKGRREHAKSSQEPKGRRE
jgi:hypothetical protein